MKISLVIPTSGRPEVLRECLKSFCITLQDLKIDFETIVVINDENPKLRLKAGKICAKYRKELNIKELIINKRLGSAKARNLGIKIAKGDIIFFFDDDIEVLPDYFRKVLPFLKKKEIGGIGAAELKLKKVSRFHKIWFRFRRTGSITESGDIISNFFYDIHQKAFYVDHLHGSNFSLKKEVIDKIGLLDENYVGIQRDETDFIYRARKAGYKLVFIPFTRVIHRRIVYGGSVPSEKKKEWCYWHYRNTSYFFFKNLYQGKKLRLAKFLIREFIFGLVRTAVYRNIFYIFEFPKIYLGYRLAQSS